MVVPSKITPQNIYMRTFIILEEQKNKKLITRVDLDYLELHKNVEVLRKESAYPIIYNPITEIRITYHGYPILPWFLVRTSVGGSETTHVCG